MDQARQRFETLAGPERQELSSSLSSLEDQVNKLEIRMTERTDWLAAHPDAVARGRHLETESRKLGTKLGAERNRIDGIDTSEPKREHAYDRDIDRDRDLPDPNQRVSDRLDRLARPAPARDVDDGRSLGLDF